MPSFFISKHKNRANFSPENYTIQNSIDKIYES